MKARVRRAANRLQLTVQYAAPRKGLPAAASIRKWAQSALERPARVTVRFVGAREGRSLNRQFRGKDYATNILSFIYDEAELAGDLLLCAPVVAREAREQHKAPRAHYAHLIVHGVLHLQGWNHENSAAERKMESREIAILAKLGIADPYMIQT
jgi:probable rRNA maturation factor